MVFGYIEGFNGPINCLWCRFDIMAHSHVSLQKPGVRSQDNRTAKYKTISLYTEIVFCYHQPTSDLELKTLVANLHPAVSLTFWFQIMFCYQFFYQVQTTSKTFFNHNTEYFWLKFWQFVSSQYQNFASLRNCLKKQVMHVFYVQVYKKIRSTM